MACRIINFYVFLHNIALAENDFANDDIHDFEVILDEEPFSDF